MEKKELPFPSTEVVAKRLRLIAPRTPYASFSDLKGLHENVPVWNKRNDLLWASWMWPILIHNGLAGIATKVQKFETVKNFLCLAMIFRDFWAISERSRENELLWNRWEEGIIECFPEITSLVPSEEDELFESVQSKKRRHRICNAILGQYSSKYHRRENDAAIAACNDMLATEPKIISGDGDIDEARQRTYYPKLLINRSYANLNSTMPRMNWDVADAYMFVIMGKMASL